MPTADKIIKEIYRLPTEEKEKLIRYILEYGIKGAQHDFPETLNIKEWQDEIASKPFNLKQASEYLGVSSVTLRRWVKTGRVLAYKIGRVYTFDVRHLKELKKAHVAK